MTTGARKPEDICILLVDDEAAFREALDEKARPSVHDALSFELTLGGEAPVNGTGILRRVRWTKTPGLPAGGGVELTFRGDPERERILEIIEATKPKAYVPSQWHPRQPPVRNAKERGEPSHE